MTLLSSDGGDVDDIDNGVVLDELSLTCGRGKKMATATRGPVTPPKKYSSSSSRARRTLPPLLAANNRARALSMLSLNSGLSHADESSAADPETGNALSYDAPLTYLPIPIPIPDTDANTGAGAELGTKAAATGCTTLKACRQAALFDEHAELVAYSVHLEERTSLPYLRPPSAIHLQRPPPPTENQNSGLVLGDPTTPPPPTTYLARSQLARRARTRIMAVVATPKASSSSPPSWPWHCAAYSVNLSAIERRCRVRIGGAVARLPKLLLPLGIINYDLSATALLATLVVIYGSGGGLLLLVVVVIGSASYITIAGVIQDRTVGSALLRVTVGRLRQKKHRRECSPEEHSRYTFSRVERVKSA
ncbi:hypothetical protein GALMADRAFT_216296 [Galerina marginata CBS 339.88]|uniref:Uncharacterized protein n=1 Tax=Galerina marginata (strain CBS 339.88) TaxID=685588 RepID=A0A067SIX0_GALM3|nr:hypothetical protein GALMADRAFT_216296 [Galerina marginata CBS 339.88]